MSETTNSLIQLAAKRFGVNPDTLTAGDDFFDKLAIDSVQALQLLSDLELQFDVEIPDYELQGVVTFQGLADLIDVRR